MQNINQFDFDLPTELIAKHPCKQRTASRLLCVDRASHQLKHLVFTDILNYIQPEDLLVVNNSRVIPARVFGHKASGGKIELLIERVLNNTQALVHIRASKSPKIGTLLYLGEDNSEFTVIERDNGLFVINKSDTNTAIIPWLNQYGHMPLPPYIDRPDEDSDQERYQTVYAKPEGSVAAPTAGLHFDESLLAKIKAQGTAFAEVTLHVGAGTFQPVRVDNIAQHQMHSEWLSVSAETCAAIIACKKRGGKVIAVGTTTVRSLETAAQAAIEQNSSDIIVPYEGDTSIFIYPGKKFHVIDKLVTNFHLPKSTLIMLVSAFADLELIKTAYHTAIEQQYRFFSYGDAMLIC